MSTEHPPVKHHENDRIPWRAEAITIVIVAVVALAVILTLRPWTNRSQPYSSATVLLPPTPPATQVPLSR